MPMMVNDGSLGVKQPLAVLLDQDCGKDASKKNSISADIVSQDPTNHISHHTYQFAAHPFHHLLIDANDGK
jgi:hypothetical protein